MSYERQCILCAVRGRRTRLEAGHVCAPCSVRLLDDLSEVVRLACEAAAFIPPASGTGLATGAYGSRPPINLAAVDPELAVIHPDPDDGTYAPTILECLEAWERMVRDDRGMAKYGPVSAERAARRERAR